MESGYQQEPIGGGRVRFTVRPAPAPRASAAAWAPAALVVGIVAVTTPAGAGEVQLAIRLGLSVILGAWARRRTARWLESRLDRRRSPGGIFVASPFGVEVGDARIDRGRLERLIVRNALAGGSGAARTGLDAAVSYALDAQAAGTFTRLAGGMTEPTAIGLLAEVSRVIGVRRPEETARPRPADAQLSR